MAGSNLRDRASRMIEKMLSLDEGSQEEFGDKWKVLVYDNDCRDVISPLLNIGSLRQKGVTLHMLLHTDREAVPDAPAIYFVRPTEANLKRIAEDCARNLYRSVYLNFVSRVERHLLEKFAQDLVSSNSVNTVVKIVDQYLDMIALEPSLFTLNIPRSFMAYNAKAITEKEIKGFMGRVASGLLSAVRVMGTLPIIRAPGGGAAEMLAQELGSLLRENLSPRGPAQALLNESLGVSQHQPRTLMLIFDRSADMAPPLQHTSTYQALVDDLLDHRLNRVTVDLDSSKGKSDDSTNTKKKTYDLNTQSDAFFSLYASEPFPEAVEANERELAEVSQREAEIRSRPGGATTGSSLDTKGNDLTQAIESLPEILAKKANLEAHTNVLQAVMHQIAARDVPTFFEIEQDIVSNGNVTDKTVLLNLLRDGSKGGITDKTRLLLVVAIAGDASDKQTWGEYETAFIQGCAVMSVPSTKEEIDKIVAAVSFVRRLQSLQSPMGSIRGGAGGSSYAGAGGGNSGGLSSFLKAAGSQASSLVAQATSFFTKFSPLYVSRVVDNLSEGRACTEADTFCSIDPRKKSTDLVDLHGTKFSEVCVFVVGGGCYTEFYNLQELRKLSVEAGNTLRHVTYGCTELFSADGFLEQLKELSLST